MESRVDQSSLASTSTSVPPQETESDFASPATNNEAKSTRTKKIKKPRIILQGTADEILDRNAARSASPAFVEKLVARAGTHWNKFYSNHAKNPATNQFFKDRHWTDRAWPQLAQLAEPVVPKGKGKAVLEVGCGTGAFIYPYSLLPLVFFSNDTHALDTSGCSNGIRKLATSHSTLRKSELPFSLLFSSLPLFQSDLLLTGEPSCRAVELTKVGVILAIRPEAKHKETAGQFCSERERERE